METMKNASLSKSIWSLKEVAVMLFAYKALCLKFHATLPSFRANDYSKEIGLLLSVSTMGSISQFIK